MSSRKTAKPAEPEVCPKCEGLGYFIDDTTNTTIRCDCGRVDTLEYRRRLQQSDIPARFLEKGFSNFVAKDAVTRNVISKAHEYAEYFGDEWNHGLLLRGSPGSGKTHIAVAIMKAIMQKGYTGHYTNFTDLLSRIRATYSENSVLNEEDLLRPIDEAELLVLDDVGAESISDWVRDRLYLIVNRRYEGAKPVLITTNCDEHELEARIGPRTASRLYEMCDFAFPPFPKVDYRKAMMH